MVNMLAADPTLEVRPASRKATAGWKGSPKTNSDGARRRYITLRNRGGLPEPETPSLLLARRLAEIDALYLDRDLRIQTSRSKLVDAELKARARGLDLSGDLVAMLKGLESAKEGLESLATASSDYAFSILLHRGISDRKEAAAIIAQAVEQYGILQENIALLREVIHLRASIPSDG